METETLFAMEVAVEHLYLKAAVTCFVPMFGFRLLDFPTISVTFLNSSELSKVRHLLQEEGNKIIYHSQIPQLQQSTGTYNFNKAKSCLFKNNLKVLTELCYSTPLYVMLLDDINETPKLVGTCCITMENIIKRINIEVEKHNNVESICSFGEKDIYSLYNLMGSKIGEVSLGLRLVSLGTSMLKHLTTVNTSESTEFDKRVKNMKTTISSKSSPVKTKLNSKNSEKIHTTNKENRLVNDINNKLIQTTQMQMLVQKSKAVQHPKPVEDNTNTFYPPAMYYANESKVNNDEKSHKTPHLKESDDQKEYFITPTKKESNITDKIMYPTSTKKAQTIATQTAVQDKVLKPNIGLPDFPILNALVGEIAKLGLVQQNDLSKGKTKNEKPNFADANKNMSTVLLNKSMNKQKNRVKSAPVKKQGPLKFGTTHTMKLRMALMKATKETENLTLTENERRVLQYSKSHHQSTRKKQRFKKVEVAVGPDVSMLRRSRSFSQEIRAQTVFMGQLHSKQTLVREQEGTDLDIPSLTQQSSDENNIVRKQNTNTVERSESPRAVSRQSQRSIEIRLPTASTDFTSEKDYTEDWSASSMTETHDNEKVKVISSKDSQQISFLPKQSMNTTGTATSDYSDKYSDDFDDEQRTATDHFSIKSSRSFENIQSETENIPPVPVNKSLSGYSTIGETTESSFDADFKQNIYNISDLPSPAGVKSTPTYETDSSSISKGTSSVVTARMASQIHKEEQPVKKLTALPIPEPMPSDSPVIQSLATTNSQSVTNGSYDGKKLPYPEETSLVSDASVRSKPKKRREKNKINFPTMEKVSSNTKNLDNSQSNKHSRRFKPSPPSSKYSPQSSTEASFDKHRRKYRHPSRRTHHSSSGSETASPEPHRPTSVIPSESVSSYQPSDLSEISDIKMSEDLGNLSDILSEENSQKI